MILPLWLVSVSGWLRLICDPIPVGLFSVSWWSPLKFTISALILMLLLPEFEEHSSGWSCVWAAIGEDHLLHFSHLHEQSGIPTRPLHPPKMNFSRWKGKSFDDSLFINRIRILSLEHFNFTGMVPRSTHPFFSQIRSWLIPGVPQKSLPPLNGNFSAPLNCSEIVQYSKRTYGYHLSKELCLGQIGCLLPEILGYWQNIHVFWDSMHQIFTWKKIKIF